MKLILIIPIVFCCAMLQTISAGSVEQKWSQNGDKIRAVLNSSIRAALDELPESSRIPEKKKIETVAFMTSLIYNYIDKEIIQIENDLDNLATLGEQLMKDGAKLLLLRARWPTQQVESAVLSLIRSYENKLANPKILHNPRMSALDLEHIIQEILITLSQDPQAVALFQWLSTIPASLHRIADELFTNKTFPEIFEMLGIDQEAVDFATLLAPLNEELGAPRRDNKAFLDKLTHVVKAGLDSIHPEVDAIKDAIKQVIAEKQTGLDKLDLNLRQDMMNFNEALWGKIRKFSLHILNA